MQDTDLTDEDRAIQVRKDQKDARSLEVGDLKWLMSTKQGRRVVCRLLARSGLHERSFTGNSETFFREGRRSVGLELQADITSNCFPEYVQMLQEAKAPTK